jgi:hypothetical protein
LESYHAGRYRGYGYQKNGTMMIEIPTTTTSTTTTTTATTKTTIKEKNSSAEPGVDSGKGTFDEQTGRSNNETNADETEESSGNAGYIVIVVIIIVLIAAAILLFGLHYKRKLPESFYNLGGLIKGDKQWKPVLAKDTDEDLKKHPTIVKNGGANGTNGTSPAKAELGTVESTNINPELSTVTWTTENNKTEADLHLEAEQKPLKEEIVENE